MWIQYPVYVTIDTNIFISSKYDFSSSSTLDLLAKFVKNDKIKVVLSNIVIREVEKHIMNESYSLCGKVRDLRKKILDTSSESFLEALELEDRFSIMNKNNLRKKSKKIWENYLETISPEVLDTSDIDLDSIINDYFEINPPFQEGEKKRKEFPDAFIANQIKARFGQDISVAIISNDNGFKAACGSSDNFHFFDSLGQLFDCINSRDDLYEECSKFVNSMLPDKTKFIEKYLLFSDSLDVDGIVYDNKGVANGFEYDETFVTSVNNTSCKLDTIDDINDKSIWVTLICESDVLVECIYDDYDNAAWDSETKSYIFLETRCVKEKHKAVIRIRVEVKRDNKEFRILPFRYTLNNESLIERFEEIEADSDDYLKDIDRKELGFVALNEYDSYLDEILDDSDFKKSVIEIFDDINSLYSNYEDISNIVDQCLSIIKNNMDNVVLKKVSMCFKDYNDFPLPEDTSAITIDEIDDIVCWFEEQQDYYNELSDIERLPDNLKYGDNICIRINDQVYYLKLESLLGPLSEGEQETIEVKIIDENNNIISKGTIILTVGYLNFDEEGCASDGLEDDVEFSCSDIVSKLNSLKDELKSNIEKNLEGYEKLKKIIS